MPSHRHSIGDESRQRMIRETAAFIEWGLRHPELVARIPAKPESEGGWPAEVGRFFWATVLRPRDIRRAGINVFRKLASRLRGR
jgi:hypothetical protein